MVAPVIGICFCCAERYGTRRSRLHRAGSAGGPALRGTFTDHDLETFRNSPALLVQPTGPGDRHEVPARRGPRSFMTEGIVNASAAERDPADRQFRDPHRRAPLQRGGQAR